MNVRLLLALLATSALLGSYLSARFLQTRPGDVVAFLIVAVSVDIFTLRISQNYAALRRYSQAFAIAFSGILGWYLARASSVILPAELLAWLIPLILTMQLVRMNCFPSNDRRRGAEPPSV
jgi:uncharacterized membrane protein YfcA